MRLPLGVIYTITPYEGLGETCVRLLTWYRVLAISSHVRQRRLLKIISLCINQFASQFLPYLGCRKQGGQEAMSFLSTAVSVHANAVQKGEAHSQLLVV